ncbi:hypothetical protein [Streptomyces sp. NPDC127197]|uniref:hypothetical protein n=1 Tax=Streptomyces sp. NPDC127197 TaxID=3345388 RepID=UPI00362B2053
MPPAFAELPAPDEEFAGRLLDAVEEGQVMTVTADVPEAAGRAVTAVLDERGRLAGAVRVAVREPGNRTAVIDALYAALLPGRHGRRPRLLSEAERAIDAQLVRRSRVILVAEDAHQLRSDGLRCLHGTWRAAEQHGRPLPLILTGTTRLTAVLDRPALDGLHIYARHHLHHG